MAGPGLAKVRIWDPALALGTGGEKHREAGKRAAIADEVSCSPTHGPHPSRRRRVPSARRHLSHRRSHLTIPDPTPALPATRTQAVQVLQMWNQWALVRFPNSGEQRWVDLERTPHAPLASAVPGGTPTPAESSVEAPQP